MSAFVCENEQICYVVSSLSDIVKTSRRADLASRINRILQKSEFSLEREYMADFALAMHNMNVNAVCQRYEDEKGDYHFKFKFAGDTGLVQTYKYLQSFLYQCCEGNVVKHPLYAMLHEVLSAIAKSFIESTGEYKKAKWS